MARRTTPRSPKEALEISRALRNRFISPEAQATAKRLLAQQSDALPASDKPITDTERRRAAAILSDIRKKYPAKH
jgi:hypothetical protein